MLMVVLRRRVAASLRFRRRTALGATLSAEQVPAKVRNPPIVAVGETRAKDAWERRACLPPGGQSRRLVPLTTISTSWLRHAKQTSRCRQSGTGVFAPYLRACSAGSGSTWRPQSRHQTIKRTPAAAAPPSVISGPGGDFFRRSALGASSLLGYRLRWSILPRRRGAPHLTRVPSWPPPLSSAAG
jgi:hypothetical protein